MGIGDDSIEIEGLDLGLGEVKELSLDDLREIPAEYAYIVAFSEANNTRERMPEIGLKDEDIAHLDKMALQDCKEMAKCRGDDFRLPDDERISLDTADIIANITDLDNEVRILGVLEVGEESDKSNLLVAQRDGNTYTKSLEHINCGSVH